MSIANDISKYITEKNNMMKKVKIFPTIDYKNSKIICEDVDRSANPYILGKIKAILLITDRETQNNTFYSSRWADEVLFNNPIFQEKLSKKLIGGELDHPDKPGTSTGSVAFSVIKLWKEGNVIWGELEIFDTSAGRDMWVLLKSGVVLGFSLRGLGADHSENGVSIIESEGFELIGWDAVWDPSVIGAEFKSFTESKKATFISEMKKYKENSNMAKQILETVNKSLQLEQKKVETIFENKQLKSKVTGLTQKNESLNLEVTRISDKTTILENKLVQSDRMIREANLRVESKQKLVNSLNEKIKTLQIEKSLLNDSINDKNLQLEKAKKDILESKKEPEQDIIQIIIKEQTKTKETNSVREQISNTIRRFSPLKIEK